MENKIACTDVFGKRLKELRKANGYTIEQFAEIVGIAKSSVGYYENAKRLPDVKILTRIADALNVSADYLISASYVLRRTLINQDYSYIIIYHHTNVKTFLDSPKSYSYSPFGNLQDPRSHKEIPAYEDIYSTVPRSQAE